MHSSLSTLMRILMIGTLICIIAACAKPYHLQVNYHLPEAPGQLATRKP